MDDTRWPTSSTSPTAKPTRPGTLLEHELARLYKAATHPRDRAVVALMIDTGLRSREVLDLRPEDLNLLNFTVTVRRGKNGRPRTVPLSYDAVRVLGRWVRGREHGAEWLFHATRSDLAGDQLTATGLRLLLKRLGKRAGLSVSPHLLRHSFARSFVVQEGSVAALKTLLGHSSLDVTSKYVSLMMGDLAAQHGSRSPFAAVQRVGRRVEP